MPAELTTTPPPHHVPRRDDRLIVALLALVTVLAYARALGNDFINFDDPAFVLDNPHVRAGLTTSSVAWAFGIHGPSQWHPLTWLSHMLDVEFFGVDPAGHHLTNVLLHAGSVVLLLRLLRRTTGALWPSAIVAALFALHPQHVESVAWVSERKDVLSVFLALVTLSCYATYVRRPSLARYATLLIVYALALMAKPLVVTLPFAMLLLDFWPLRRLDGPHALARLFVEKLPLLALAVAASIMTILCQRAADAVGSLEKYSLRARIFNAALAYVWYLRKTFWPADLSVFYPYPKSFNIWHVGLAAAVLLAISVAAVALARRRPYFFTGWFWFLGTLLPMIGLVQVGVQGMADRYAYLPHIGLFIAITWGLADTARAWQVPRAIISAAAAAALIALTVTTVVQVGYWRDSMTLFAHALSLDPTNYLAHHQFANELARGERPDLPRAEQHYRAALASHPQHPKSHMNLGNVLARQRRLSEAEASLRQAIRLDPKLARAYLSLGVVLSRQQRFAEAADQFEAALRLDPALTAARDGLADARRRAATLPATRPATTLSRTTPPL